MPRSPYPDTAEHRTPGRAVRAIASGYSAISCPECGHAIPVRVQTARWTIRSPRDVAERLLPQLGLLEREELWVLTLNTKNVVLHAQSVYRGNVSASLVRIGELFSEAVKRHAAGVVLVHNHPSGDPTPSPDDLHMTAEAVAAGHLLDIAVLDHIVIAADGYVSLRDRGVSFDRPSYRQPA